MIPLSALNQFMFCPRRAALIHVEGVFTENHYTLQGNLIHEHADLAGYEVVKGVKLLRALPVWSERLGLNGKCDIVEQRADGSHFPVEFKLGKRRKWLNNDVQLCAQALCLEEMFGSSVPFGAVFHANSKRRQEVEFTVELRHLTVQTAREMHELISAGRVPASIYKPACEECSLFQTCLPKATGNDGSALRLLKQLFQT